MVEAPNCESVVTPVDLEPHQSSTGLQGAIVTENPTLPLVMPFPTRQNALEARFQDFNVHNAPDTEKMAYCIYSYNRLVKLLPNLKQMQYPKALLEGRFENRAGAPAWMDHCCPATSRTKSIGCLYRLSRYRSRMSEVPLKWGFSRTELG